MLRQFAVSPVAQDGGTVLDALGILDFAHVSAGVSDCLTGTQTVPTALSAFRLAYPRGIVAKCFASIVIRFQRATRSVAANDRVRRLASYSLARAQPNPGGSVLPS